jgi:hypothetical protein
VTTFEIWSLAIGAISASISLALLVVVAFELFALRRQLNETFAAEERRHAAELKRATMDVFTATMNARYELRSNLPDDTDVDAIQRFVEEVMTEPPQSAGNRALVRYLGYWENVALGVNVRALDLEMIYRLSGARIVRLAELYDPWIRWRRARAGSTTLYVELETLSQTIRQLREAEGIATGGDGLPRET